VSDGLHVYFVSLNYFKHNWMSSTKIIIDFTSKALGYSILVKHVLKGTGGWSRLRILSIGGFWY